MAATFERQKTVLITGCTPGGIGYATAKKFKGRGWRVLATARSHAVLAQLAHEGFIAVQLDVAKSDSISACRRLVEWHLDGKLDVLVNNAGRGLVTPSTDIKLEDARAVFETNLFGVMGMVTAFIDLLIPARGLIINVSSASSVIPYWSGSVYAASKAALNSYSRTLRMELRPFDVRVMVVMAGTVKSNIANDPKGGLPEDSLYQRAKYLYVRRLNFSQREESAPMSTDYFASKVVAAALSPETSGFWRSLFGRPDWFWYGGMSRAAYWGSWIGEWATDSAMWRTFGLHELEAIVRKGEVVEASLMNTLASEDEGVARFHS